MLVPCYGEGSIEFAVDYVVYEKGRRAPQWTLEGDIAGEMSLADFLHFTKTNLILISDHALREEQDRGFDKNPVTSVDGRVGKPVIAVNPLGKIEFTARQNIREILIAAYAGVEERSPVDTGLYRRSNYVFLNGKQVATNRASLEAWLGTNPQIGEKDIIRLVNIQPYARKLERYAITAQTQGGGASLRTTKSRDQRGRSGAGGRVLAPNGTYYLTTKQILRKYKNNSAIRFEFIPGSLLGLNAARFKLENVRHKDGHATKVRRKKPGNTYLYPSIKITVSGGGIL